jgi:hypothetical protein
LSRGSNEIAQNCHVRAVSADAPGIHRQTETLGKIKIHTSVVQLRQAEALRRQHSIYARRIHRPRRAVTPPRAPRQLVKLFPIAFVPSRHSFHRDPGHAGVNLSTNTFLSPLWMHARPIRFTSFLPHIPSPGNTASTNALRPIHILHKSDGNPFSLPVVSNTLRDELFRETHHRRRRRGAPSIGHIPVVFLLTNRQIGYMPRGILHTFAHIDQCDVSFAQSRPLSANFRSQPYN